jgi:large subunit ribosomal protein L23
MSSIGEMTKILVRPVVTEKSTRMQEENKFTFEVTLTANRAQVKQAVEKLFEVKVKNVNMIRTPGKRRRFGRRQTQGPERKKAVVTLQPGDKIGLFEVV